MVKLSYEEAQSAAATVLAASGAPKDIADRMGGWLARSDLSGHPSHGLVRVPEYVGHLLEGRWKADVRPRILNETDSVVSIDCGMGFGHPSAELLTKTVAAKALTAGVAFGSVTNETHAGRLGEWTELAVESGVFFLIGNGRRSGAMMAPYGGKEARMSNNPISFGAPGLDGDSIIVDFAGAMAAEGKIRMRRDSGLQLPDGWVLDKHGVPTRNPNEFYDGGMLLPFGEHKGYGIALMTASLGGALAAAASPGTAQGLYAIGIAPNVVGDAREARAGVQDIIQRMRSTPPRDGYARVDVPGDYERRCRNESNGFIDIAKATWEQIVRTSKEVGVSIPQPAETVT